ncbi:MAG TPA: VWA domain-containing protein, partial [Solirubrobacterales bacterium]|nr:VWA domain-containing protein [Solirubrobacterales bacterium]
MRRGRLDLRRTVRRALRTDGDAFHLAWTSVSPRPRRIVLLCDVSGSMERFSRVLLASLRAAVAAGIDAEAFAVATGLTRLTGTLGDRDGTRALERARASVGDWSGGTRIGAALAEFNRAWGRRGIARGAIVIVFSDGWDRGDPELLARETRRLQLQARRLIWVNPRPAEIDMQPLAIGMRAAMPHV